MHGAMPANDVEQADSISFSPDEVSLLSHLRYKNSP
jgi:hypothetical protein